MSRKKPRLLILSSTYLYLLAFIIIILPLMLVPIFLTLAALNIIPDKWLVREFTPTVAAPTKIKIFNLETKLSRAINDRSDDVSGYQVKVIYALPSDKQDLSLDTNGKISTSVAAFQQWFGKQTGSQQLKLDTYKGALDIAFVRLKQTDEQIKVNGAFARESIENELKTLRFNNPQKLYAVYYGGGSNVACGGAPYPPNIIGNVAVIYLEGTPPNSPACNTNILGGNINQPAYLEFAMLHEIVHGLGFVASCAPHHTLSGHVSDSPQDLMYAGNQPWQPSSLDINRDDYFRQKNPSCLDLSKSIFLDPSVPNAVVPPGWK